MSGVVLKLRGKWRALCAAGALALALPCAAQHYTFSEIASGMDNLNVNAIAQGKDGYLWVGTENGLYRYDGRQFRKFSSEQGLRGLTIQNLFVGPDGTLFVGTSDGIFFKRRDGNFAEIDAPAPGNPLLQRIGTEFAATDADHVVALARNDGYLLHRSGPDAWTAAPMNLKGGTLWGVLATPDGGLWYGCDNDLCHLANGKTSHLRETLHLPADEWWRMLLTRDGHIWMRSASHIGEIVPATEGSFRYLPHDFPGHMLPVPFNDLAEDAHGHVVATDKADFGIWEDGHWRMVTQRNGLTPYDISALLVDKQGTIWMGEMGHGLTRWVGQDQWEAFTTAEGLSDDIVWSELRDRVGRIWVGTEQGLDWIAPQDAAVRQWRGSNVPTARSDTIAETADGALWVGSGVGGLVRIDERSLAGRGWKMPAVFKLASDGAHTLWIATDSGLYTMDPLAPGRGPRRVEDAAFAHPNMRFNSVIVDGEHRVWAASTGGLYCLDGSGWKHIEFGPSGANPYAIAVDRSGDLWVTGVFPGLMRLRIEGGRVAEAEQFGLQHLLSLELVSLMVDHRGWLWIGQDAGVTVYDGHSWRSYTHDDGLIWNGTDSNGLYEDRDGSIWIGTSGGLAHLLHPETVPAVAPQKPAFAAIDYGSKEVTPGAEIPWSASPLSVSIAALNFGDVEHIRIRYRLVGLDPDWVQTNDEDVRYARLDPGDYTFQAQTVSAAGGAQSPVAEIAFSIKPNWWQSWEMRTGFILVIVCAIAFVWRKRLEVLNRRTRALEEAVRMRTEDLEREKAELVRTREQMRHFAEHDDLTGLWNHRIIIERLRSEVDRSRREHSPLSVILADLDHFKRINDTLGHQAGDNVLRRIGAEFLHSVRTYDWVGRYGGEEFLLILPHTTFEHARARAEQLRQAVERICVVEGETKISINVSLGVASGLPSDYQSLIRTADEALYRAKDNGRNCVVAAEIS